MFLKRAENTIVGVPIWPKCKLLYDYVYVVVNYNYEKDPNFQLLSDRLYANA